MSRRAFLASTAGTSAWTAAGAGLAAGGLGALLSGCQPSAAAPPGHPRLPRPNAPVAWPVSLGNPPIGSGLAPERHATLRVFTWPGHVNPQCLRAFGKRYHCTVELTSFATFGRALAVLRECRERFDVLLGAPSYMIGRLVWPGLIQPLNHSYLPNVRRVWPYLANPYYDHGARYTVPYTVCTTGIGWRTDLVDLDPYALDSGWDFPWTAAGAVPKGKIALLDDYRASIGLALLKNGVTDLNTTDPVLVDEATTSLLRLDALARPAIGNNTTADLATGRSWIHLAWSGQVAAAARYLPKGVSAQVLGYWFPPDGTGPVGNDTGVVLRGARHPVLAHLLLNYLLGFRVALENMAGTGYVQPLDRVTPERLVDEGIVPATLTSACVLPTYVDHGLKQLELPIAGDKLWVQCWDAVSRRSSYRTSAD